MYCMRHDAWIRAFCSGTQEAELDRDPTESVCHAMDVLSESAKYVYELVVLVL